MRSSATNVVIGPAADLHVGVKGALLDAPPAGVSYDVCESRHAFVFPASKEAGDSPFLTPHWGEVVKFRENAPVVHSARWPVINQAGWVVDTDDIGYPMLAGRYALNPEFAKRFRATWTADYGYDIRRRLENMLAAYAHPSCISVLFRSEATARVAERWLVSLSPTADTDRVLSKVEIVYPAVPASAPAELARKWRASAPFQILFCGRDFESKNGALALDIFDVLSHEYPHLTLIYIGSIPEAVRDRYSGLLGRIKYCEKTERAEVLRLLQGAHVLFHPSRFESLGVIFIEACAMGVAVVTASGKGMTHTRGLLGSGALFVDRDLVDTREEEAAFLAHLRTLIMTPDLARSMGESNYQLSASGVLSLGRRNAVLQRVYEQARCRSGEGLLLDSLPRLEESRIVYLDTRQVCDAHAQMRTTLGITHDRVDI